MSARLSRQRSAAGTRVAAHCRAARAARSSCRQDRDVRHAAGAARKRALSRDILFGACGAEFFENQRRRGKLQWTVDSPSSRVSVFSFLSISFPLFPRIENTLTHSDPILFNIPCSHVSSLPIGWRIFELASSWTSRLVGRFSVLVHRKRRTTTYPPNEPREFSN